MALSFCLKISRGCAAWLTGSCRGARGPSSEEEPKGLVQDGVEVHAGHICPSMPPPPPPPVHPLVPGPTVPQQAVGPSPWHIRDGPQHYCHRPLGSGGHASLTGSSWLLETASGCSLFLLGGAEAGAAAQQWPTRDPPSPSTLGPHLWGPASLPCSSR